MSEPRPEAAWLAEARSAAARGDTAGARLLLEQAIAAYPASHELRRTLAGVRQQAGQDDAAEHLLRELLAEAPGDAGAAFALARLCVAGDRPAAAASALRRCFTEPRNARDSELAIAAIELLSDCGRQRDAAAIAEAAIRAMPADPRLHAYAGMLAIQLGDFTRARERYLYAIEHDPRAAEWHAPIGLSHTLRYPDPGHPDVALFERMLTRSDLSPLARAELHFALAKAADDYGDRGAAAAHFREANALKRPTTGWSRKAWRRAIEARLAASPLPANPAPDPEFVPVFIVGMPRSGTTLLADLLSRYPAVRNRGELQALGRIAMALAAGSAVDAGAIRRSALEYALQARQDDAADARWFIDKQPLNFRYVDLALALFPHARILHCRRSPRDIALSLWMQCFLDNAEDYAYDLGAIATVLRDEARMMARWQRLFPDSIHDVRYERLVEAPDATIATLAQWIGLPQAPVRPTSLASPTDAVSTASVWQVRQPVNTRSVARWKPYATLVPELLRIPES